MTINGKDYVVAHDGDQLISAAELSGATAWEVVAGAQPDDILEYESLSLGNPARYVPVTDHRNSIVGWWNIVEVVRGGADEVRAAEQVQ